MRSVALLPLALLLGCNFSSTATRWNGCVGSGGRPVYVKSHTNVGLKLVVFVPFLGSTTLPDQIDLLTRDIARENGNSVRMIESSEENYWYGFPPITWVVTPVITRVAADYEPSPETLSRDLAGQEKSRPSP